MQTKQKICINCKFFSADAYSENDSGTGECRRNAPDVGSRHNGGRFFPETAYDDWCGEYRRSFIEIDDESDASDKQEQEYDVYLSDADDDNNGDAVQQYLFGSGVGTFVDDDIDDDISNPYADWENKDSAIDAIVDRLDKVEDATTDLEADVDALKNFRTWTMEKIEKLEKEVQILKQPKERIGW